MSSVAPTFRKIGKYEIQAELGRGGFGRVFRALDPDVKRLVAIKVLVTQADKDLRARFQFEAAAAGNLQHKNIVTIYEFGEYEQQPFLVMEFLEGQTLQELISRRQPLTLLQKMAVMSQVADGLQCAHTHGVIHRDVKPANIMVLPDGTVKIMDFGIARATRQDATRLTGTGYFVGTLRYMAPEQFENVDAGVLGDIFAYGMIYYELLTGKHPFDAPEAAMIMFKIRSEDPPNIRELVPDCPDALDRIVRRALTKNRALRYQSLEELQFDAEPLAVGLRRKRAEELLQEANGRATGERPESAVALLRELLELDPSNHEALLLRSSLQQRVQQRALKSRIDALLTQANDLVSQGKLTEAIVSFESAAALDPHDAGAQWSLNRARALQHTRKKADQLISEARQLRGTEDLAGALHKASEAVRIDSQSLEAKGVLETIRKEVDRRESENRWKGQLEKAEGLLMIREFDEALSVIDAIDVNGPGQKQLAELRARVVKEQFDYQRRRRLSEEIGAARNFIKQRKFEEAVRRLESLVPEYEGEDELRNLLRHARDQWRAWQRATATQEIKREAESLCASARFEAAIGVLERGLRSVPGEAELLNLLEKTLAAKTDADRELAVSGEIQRIDELRRAGRLQEASEVLDSALRSLGDDPSLMELHRELRAQLDEQRRAEAIRLVIEDARGLIENGRSSSAVFRLRSAAAQFPGEAPINDLLQLAEEKVREQQRAQAIQTVCNEVRMSAGARNFGRALQQLAEALNEFPGDSALLALEESVKADQSSYERERRFEQRLLHCEGLRQESRLEDALDEIAQLAVEYGQVSRLATLREEITRDLDEQKQIEALRVVSSHARELIRQNRPEDAIQAVRDSAVDPGIDPELSGLMKIAEGAIADRLKRESIRQIASRAAQLEAAGELDQARQTLEEGQRQFPENADLVGAAGRLQKKASDLARQEEISRQCALIETKLEARDWAAAVKLIQRCLDKYGQDARFTRFGERALLIKADEAEAERRSIAEVLERARELERQFDLTAAVVAVERGLRTHPESCELGEELAHLRDLIRQRDLAQKVSENVIQIEQRITAKNWVDAARLVTAARQELGANPAFDQLFECIRAGEADQAAEQRQLIQAVLDRVRALVQNQQLAAALQASEDGVRLYPDSMELAQTRATIAQQFAARKRRQKIAEQLALIEQWLTANDIERALALSEAGCREFPDEPAFASLLDRSRAEERRQSLELVITNVKAAIAAGNLETAKSQLSPAQKHFQNEAALAQLERELIFAQSRRDKLATATAMLQRGRIDAAEKICRDLLAVYPSDPDAISLLEQISIKRTDRQRLHVAKESRRAQRSLWTRWWFIATGVLAVAAVLVFILRSRQEVPQLKVPVAVTAVEPPKLSPQLPPPNPPPAHKEKDSVPSVSKQPKTAKLPPPKEPVVNKAATDSGAKPLQPPPTSPVENPAAARPKVASDNPKPVQSPPKTEGDNFSLADYHNSRLGSFEWTGPASRQQVEISPHHASIGRIAGGPPAGIPVHITSGQGVRIIEQPAPPYYNRFVFETDGTSVSLTFKWEVYQP